MKRLYTNYLKTFYGITDPFDEYKKGIVGQELIQIFPIFYLGSLLSSACCLILGYRYPEAIAFALPCIIFLLGFGCHAYLFHRLKKANVNDFDMEELSQQKIAQLKQAPIKFTILLTASVFVWMLFGEMVLEGATVQEILTTPRTYVTLAIGAVVFFSGVSWSTRKTIKQREKEAQERKETELLEQARLLIATLNKEFQASKQGLPAEESIQHNINETLKKLEKTAKVDNTVLVALEKFYQSTSRTIGLSQIKLTPAATQAWREYSSFHTENVHDTLTLYGPTPAIL